MKIVLATRNVDKVREIKDALRGLAIEILTLENFPDVPEIVEDGFTIQENALKKARVVQDIAGGLVLADDTGLEVDFLNGEPGVFSSRFAGENASYDDNVEKLLSLMKGVPAEKRTARFRCVIALVGEAIEQTVEGVAEGLILTEKRGIEGFGYDPVFYVPVIGKTFAEMSLDDKNRISHRGLALEKVRVILKALAEHKQ
ncbi:XTP/dITP diphosphatase [candidate division KSB1 bacterium]|nr:XTP/dITP diphosphatase [candidate division KSB1 bacterium]